MDSARVDDAEMIRVRIFEPFGQLSHPHSEKGSGPGLAICYQFTKMMRGSIEVESELGRVFTFFRVKLFVFDCLQKLLCVRDGSLLLLEDAFEFTPITRAIQYEEAA